MVELRNLKGTIDRGNEHCLIQNYVISVIKNAFERYGFNPLETPIIEFNDILSSKYAGGTEIVKEMYTLKDNGERDLALRYDLTVPLCRYIGINERSLKFPYKRYEIGKIYRDGPIKLGRLREFYQCDCDIVGSNDILYDAECLAVVSLVLKKLGKDFKIEINNRKLLTGIINEAGIQSENLASSIILSLDKMKKIGKKGVEEELIEKGVGPSTFEPIFKKIVIDNADINTNLKLVEYYESNLSNELASEGLEEIKQLLNYCEKMGIVDNIIFRPELARGLEIYTGSVFEVFFRDSEVKSSIAGGGRYDKIIGKFLDKDKKIPAVGISFGLEPIIADIMTDPDSYPYIERKKTSVEAMIIPIKVEIDEILPFITQLRNQGVKCELYNKKKKGVKEGLGLANFLGIPITIIIGKKELESGELTIKDMENEQQFTAPIDKMALKIKQILTK
ncbi:MAG: histidine--tRNA ligase [archaeon]|nr:histidine--tRNA ligase [archaeon]